MTAESFETGQVENTHEFEDGLFLVLCFDPQVLQEFFDNLDQRSSRRMARDAQHLCGQEPVCADTVRSSSHYLQPLLYYTPTVNALARFPRMVLPIHMQL